MRIRGRDDQRAEAAHLFLQQADGVIELVTPEGVRADKLREIISAMNRGRLPWPHLVQHHVDAPPGRLPRRLRAGKPATHNMDPRHEATSVHEPRTPNVNPTGELNPNQERRTENHEQRDWCKAGGR